MDLVDASSEPIFVSSYLPTPEQSAQLKELLRSNSLPVEPSHLRSVIAASSDDLARYDAEIDRILKLLRHLTQLEYHRALLHEYNAGCCSVFSPIRRLPTEILIEIFALCAPEVVEYYRWGHSSHSVSTNLERAAQSHLLRLSQVSSSWRTTVISTASLWTNIEVDYSPMSSDFQTFITFKALEISLERSANCPLTIAVHASHPAARPILELLAKHSERWHSADIWIDNRFIASLRGVTGRLPLLRHLQLGGFALKDVDIFEDAPNLTRLKLANVSQTPSRFPWNQLQEFSYACVYKTELLADGLAAMRNLSRECHFKAYLDISDPNILSLTPTQSNIAYFSLAIAAPASPYHSRQALGEILGSLSLPSLEQVSLHTAGSGCPVFWPPGHALTFARYSCCCVTVLLLSNIIITADELVEYLSQLRALVHLSIEDVPSWAAGTPDHILITNGLLRRLTWLSDSSLNPRLKRLTCKSLLTFDDQVLFEFILSRVLLGQNDRERFEVRIFWCPTTPDERELDDSVWEQIEQLCDQHDLGFSLRPMEAA
ncbi:hypothetical protein C8R43DRAFT_1244806 [Mycena crocata]|nr:hypothetical protein C8R43DRAFT_1244806 [Mycena crocata]